MRVSRTKARRDTSAPDAFIMKWILSFTGFFQDKIIRIMLLDTEQQWKMYKKINASMHAPLVKAVIFFCFSKKLTWRDVQHIIVRSSRFAGRNPPDMVENGAGLKG